MHWLRKIVVAAALAIGGLLVCQQRLECAHTAHAFVEPHELEAKQLR